LYYFHHFQLFFFGECIEENLWVLFLVIFPSNKCVTNTL
jgi:hypothetical protein